MCYFPLFLGGARRFAEAIRAPHADDGDDDQGGHPCLARATDGFKAIGAGGAARGTILYIYMCESMCVCVYIPPRQAPIAVTPGVNPGCRRRMLRPSPTVLDLAQPGSQHRLGACT